MEPDGDHDPANPTDSSLSSVEHDLDRAGFEGQFKALPEARLGCVTCGAEFAASKQRADRLTRLEGASDPADMVVVVPLVCPVCRTAGTLVASYGPEATAEEAEVLVAMRRRPAEGSERSAR